MSEPVPRGIPGPPPFPPLREKPYMVSAWANDRMTGAEKFWYYFLCVVSCGSVYFAKVLRKKAYLEAMEAHLLYRR